MKILTAPFPRPRRRPDAPAPPSPAPALDVKLVEEDATPSRSMGEAPSPPGQRPKALGPAPLCGPVPRLRRSEDGVRPSCGGRARAACGDEQRTVLAGNLGYQGRGDPWGMVGSRVWHT
jgi:hypothetical protein